MAVSSGVDLIAHLPGTAVRSDSAIPRFEIADRDAALAARRGVIVVPTAWLATQDRIAGGDTAQVRRTREVQRHNLALLRRAGVPLAVGSDLFVTASHEAAYLLELGGVNATELLRMWTETTARAAFPARKLGRLQPGFEASLLALACDPIADFACTKQITLRMKQGRLLPMGSRP